MGVSGAIIFGMATIANAQSQASAQRSQADFSAQANEMNARVAEIQAEDAVARGNKASNAQRAKTKQIVGSQRAALAAQGIDVDFGSAADVQNETEFFGTLDALTIKNNAWREAWGYKTQASQYLNQAQFSRISGQTAAQNTLISGGINAAVSAASAYVSYKSGNYYGGTKATTTANGNTATAVKTGHFGTYT